MIDKLFAVGFSLVAAITFAVGCAAQDNAQWQYRPIAPMREEIVIEAGGTVGIGHAGFDAEFCSGDAPLVCFRSRLLSFAVPRQIANATVSWQDGGISYTITELRREIYLGQEFDAYFINATSDEWEHDFVFSPERGLLSILIRDGQSTVPFISIEYCGFGAPETCVEPPSVSPSR